MYHAHMMWVATSFRTQRDACIGYKKPWVIQDSSDEEDSSNDSEAADTLEAGRF